ncbi:transposase [Peribacillus asahii]|uniref:Transposase n=1 Tax=Peribacillus asahii TaxID=228899 RepID=A0A398AWR4_9BACI|nr:transposase [Peribacillus asahii]RID81494.1 transposase [Peribacillus asahii]
MDTLKRDLFYNTIIIHYKKGVFILAKHYDQAYKDHVSKLVVEQGRKASELSYELEISPKTISRWVKDYRTRINGGKPNEPFITPTELEKLKKQHEKELAQLREENEILKKAMHIFTKNQA